MDNDKFLVEAHIARWTDVESLRGQTSNRLFLCFMHDKAFEIGLFTITDDFRVQVTVPHPHHSGVMQWLSHNLAAQDGESIRLGVIAPDRTALEVRRNRIQRAVRQ